MSPCATSASAGASHTIVPIHLRTRVHVKIWCRRAACRCPLYTTDDMLELGLGEFRASDRAWRYFGDHVSQTQVGFAWINDIGACADVHDWLLGIGSYANGGILRGRFRPLAQNRKKTPDPVPAW